MNLKNNFALLFVLVSYVLSYTNAEYRIIEGEDIHITESAHSVAIFHEKTYTCVGSIVSIKSVVTVAHCVKGKLKTDLFVQAGVAMLYETDMDIFMQKRYVENVLPHPDYNSETKLMDIAVVKVTKIFKKTPRVKIIELCNEPLETGKMMKVSGWGSANVLRPYVMLQTKRVKIMECRNPSNAEKTTLSAGDFGTDLAFRDTGAGGVINERLCAVAQWVVPNCPDIYMDVTSPSVRDFITDNM